MDNMPLMGFGTFIGIELNEIKNHQQRMVATRDAIVLALKTGYRHLDLAENYDNLLAVKEALYIALKPVSEGGLGLVRQDIWLTMKANTPFNDGHVDALLEAVGVSYFDLFLIHHPIGLFDNELSLTQGWRALICIDNAKLHRKGVSNFYEAHLSRLLAICAKESLAKPYANEIEVNLLSKNVSLVQYCQSNEIKVIAYSPLAYAYSALVFKNEDLKSLADTLDVTAAAASLAWMMAKGITVIPKSADAKRQFENFSSQQLLKTLTDTPSLYQKLDAQKDMFADGVTGNAEDMKKHAESIKWTVLIPAKAVSEEEQKSSSRSLMP